MRNKNKKISGRRAGEPAARARFGAAVLLLLGAHITSGQAAAPPFFFPAGFFGGLMVTFHAPPDSPDCTDTDALEAKEKSGTALTPAEAECLGLTLAQKAAQSFEKLGLRLSVRPPALSSDRTAMRRFGSGSAAASSLPLSISTPYVPFTGNPLVVLGGVLDSPVLANATTGYAVGLRRQSDCSLSEDLFNDPDAATPNAVGVTSLPGAQDYLHQLAGLTTTPDVFASGCVPPTLGQPSTTGVLIVANTAAGAVYGVEAENGLTASVVDPVANTNMNTTLIAGSAMSGGVVAADLNGDGLLDLVAGGVTDPTTHVQSTAVLISNGDGTYKPAVYYDVAGDVTVDDVNGDGKPDIVVVNATGVTTLLGKGDGTFTIGPNSVVSVPNVGVAGSVLTGDFNGDGKKDLIAGGLVLLGKGDGSFTLGAPVSTDPAFNAFLAGGIANVAVGDFNKDGKLDVAVSEPGFVAIFYGKGDGTFSAGPRYAALPDIMQLTVTDIDGDGNLDIVLGTASDGVFTPGGYDTPYKSFQILMGRGDGTFVDSVAYPVYPAPAARLGGVSYGAQIATADFNGDGKADALVLDRNASSAVTFLPGDGAGNLGAAVTSAVNLTPVMVVAADMNKDGKPDLVLAGNGNSGSPQLAVVLNQGNGTFGSEADYPLPNNPVSLVVGDFNGDGFPDVAVGVAPAAGGSGPHGVYVLFGQAGGTLAAPVQIDASLYPTGLAAGDLNGDGRTDLVVADQGTFNYVGSPQQVNGAAHVYLGNANGTFTAATAPTTPATNYSVAALADLNGDGKPDLILAGNVAGTSAGGGTPYVYTLLGNGDGTFATAVGEPLAGIDGIGAISIAVADFNLDGHLDVAVGNPNDYTELLLGNGDGTVAHTVMSLAQRPTALAAVDLTGSGRPELLVGSAATIGGNLALFLNAGSWAAPVTTAATTTVLTASPNPATVGQTVTLTAQVSSSATGTPTGTVTFLDGTTSLGTGTLAQGTASFTSTALAAGTHSLTASYGGDASFAASTSSAVSLVLNAANPDFALAASSTSASVAPGASAVTNLTVTPSGGFSGSVTLACSELPAGATCSFSAPSVTVSGTAAATSTLTIATATMTAQLSGERTPRDPFVPGTPVLAGLATAGLAHRRGRRRSPYARGAVLAWAGLILAAALLHGCGGGGSSTPPPTGGTPPGTYSITVTATSGSTSHSATFALTVT